MMPLGLLREGEAGEKTGLVWGMALIVHQVGRVLGWGA